MNFLYWILIFIGAAITGVTVGFCGVLIINKLRDVKLKKEAKKFIDGDRPNEYEVDGVKKPVDTFILKRPNGEEYKVSIKGKSMLASTKKA